MNIDDFILVRGKLSDIYSLNVIDMDRSENKWLSGYDIRNGLGDNGYFKFAISDFLNSSKLLHSNKDYPLVFVWLGNGLFLEPISNSTLVSEVIDRDGKFIDAPVGIFTSSKGYFDSLGVVRKNPLMLSIDAIDVNGLNGYLVDDDFLRLYSRNTLSRKDEVIDDFDRMKRFASSDIANRQMPIVRDFIGDNVMPKAEMENLLVDRKLIKK